MPDAFISSHDINFCPCVCMCVCFIYLPHVCWDSRTYNYFYFQHMRPLLPCVWFHCVSSAGCAGPEVPLSREEEVDLTLLKNDSGVESALLYAKASSKYIKDLLAWMEKRLAMGEALTREALCWLTLDVTGSLMNLSHELSYFWLKSSQKTQSDYPRILDCVNITPEASKAL